MLKKELKKLIDESEHEEWLNNLKFEFDFHIGNTKVELKGFCDIYLYVEAEERKWREGKLLEEISIFESTKKWFSSLMNHLNRIFVVLDKKENIFSIRDSWHEILQVLRRMQFNIYLRDFSETQFIIDLYSENVKYATAADAVFTGSFDGLRLSDIDFFYGAIKTYEFRSTNKSQITERKEAEEKNINELRIEISALINESQEKTKLLQTELEEFDQAHRAKVKRLSESTEKSFKDLDQSHQEAIKKLEASTEKSFTDMDSSRHRELKKLVDDTDARFKTHEETYEKKLQLEKPAEYWEKRADELKKAANNWLIGLIAASIAGVVVITFLIFSLQEDKFTEHINNPAISIRWSILSIILLTLIAFLVKVFTKMMMSNFHLYRDAQERKQLTYFYLALSNNTEVSDADRNIILQSLFSRVDTGLLKDDSGPTMPVNLIDKINRNAG